MVRWVLPDSLPPLARTLLHAFRAHTLYCHFALHSPHRTHCMHTAAHMHFTAHTLPHFTHFASVRCVASSAAHTRFACSLFVVHGSPTLFTLAQIHAVHRRVHCFYGFVHRLHALCHAPLFLLPRLLRCRILPPLVFCTRAPHLFYTVHLRCYFLLPHHGSLALHAVIYVPHMYTHISRILPVGLHSATPFVLPFCVSAFYTHAFGSAHTHFGYTMDYTPLHTAFILISTYTYFTATPFHSHASGPHTFSAFYTLPHTLFAHTHHFHITFLFHAATHIPSSHTYTVTPHTIWISYGIYGSPHILSLHRTCTLHLLPAFTFLPSPSPPLHHCRRSPFPLSSHNTHTHGFATWTWIPFSSGSYMVLVSFPSPSLGSFLPRCLLVGLPLVRLFHLQFPSLVLVGSFLPFGWILCGACSSVGLWIALGFGFWFLWFPGSRLDSAWIHTFCYRWIWFFIRSTTHRFCPGFIWFTGLYSTYVGLLVRFALGCLVSSALLPF